MNTFEYIYKVKVIDLPNEEIDWVAYYKTWKGAFEYADKEFRKGKIESSEFSEGEWAWFRSSNSSISIEKVKLYN